jgi:uncharacterized protein (TIGR02118 family)
MVGAGQRGGVAVIRMSVYYPSQPGVTFDHAYYTGSHRQLVEESFRPLGLRQFEIERGVAGFGGGPAPYVAVGHLLFDSMESFQAAWNARGGDIVADIPKYTNGQPVVQISEIVPA